MKPICKRIPAKNMKCNDTFVLFKRPNSFLPAIAQILKITYYRRQKICFHVALKLQFSSDDMIQPEHDIKYHETDMIYKCNPSAYIQSMLDRWYFPGIQIERFNRFLMGLHSRVGSDCILYTQRIPDDVISLINNAYYDPESESSDHDSENESSDHDYGFITVNTDGSLSQFVKVNPKLTIPGVSYMLIETGRHEYIRFEFDNGSIIWELYA